MGTARADDQPAARDRRAGWQRRGRVLLVDDDQDAAELLAEALSHRGFATETAPSAERALAMLADGSRRDVVLTDLRMSGATGIELAARLAQSEAPIPVVVITAFGSIPAAIEATRRGAYDFLTKPYDPDVVALTLGRAVDHSRSMAELRKLRAAKWESTDGLYTASDAMQHTLATIGLVAGTEVTVLVSGESGTGKELVARAIHRRSARAAQPFVAINCAALPESLLESELFGHTRGAFTDARQGRTGLIARASGGTLFLDEIGDMPAPMQAKLLRVLQEGVVRPVGGDRDQSVDVRIVAATHRNLEEEVRARRFREDLFFRIHVVEIKLPPLRSRGDDVLLLAHVFLSRAAERSGRATPTISPEVASRLLAHDWPGNVRELQNVVEATLALSTGSELRETDLPERIRTSDHERFLASVAPALEEREPTFVSIEEIEQRYIELAMRTFRGNRTLVARALGLDRSTLYRKLRRYGSSET